MNKENWKKFTRKTKENYYKTRIVPCPAFNGEKIYFTSVGFKHVIRKGRKLRERSEQIKRLSILSQAPYILSSSKRYQTHYITSKSLPAKSIAKFWSFVCNKQGKKITVIVRQLNLGPKHFFSIFN